MSEDNNFLNEQESKNLIKEFIHLFEPLKRGKQNYTQHPSKDQIEEYLNNSNAMPDLWQRPQTDSANWMGAEDVALEWTLTDLSLHVQTCAQCSKVADKLRKADKSASWFQDYFSAFGFAGYRKRVLAWTYTASAAVALMALVLNVMPSSFNPIDHALVSDNVSVVDNFDVSGNITLQPETSTTTGDNSSTFANFADQKPIRLNDFRGPIINQF